jgi:hypothetical protein
VTGQTLLQFAMPDEPRIELQSDQSQEEEDSEGEGARPTNDIEEKVDQAIAALSEPTGGREKRTALDVYLQLQKISNSVYGDLTFFEALHTFPRAPMVAFAGWYFVWIIQYLANHGAAHAQAASFNPPLGLPQSIFNYIVVMFSCLFALLVAGIFWAGYINKPKNAGAAAVLQHLVTFLSGALLGLRV